MMEPVHGGNGREKVHGDLLHGGAVTSTIPPVHKQGYLGDISEKSMTELEELLVRQESILKNRKFVERLPDKGEKIRNFAKTLHEIISKRENANVSIVDNPPPLEEIESKQINIQKIEMGDAIEQKHESELKIIERGFSELSIHEGAFYKVVVNAEERKHKSKFTLNRPQKKTSADSSPSSDISKTTRHVTHSTELTSASVRDPHPATVISVSECQSLYTTQRGKIQELRAEHLAERVMRRIHGNTKLEDPEGRYQSKDNSGIREDVIDPDQEFLESVD